MHLSMQQALQPCMVFLVGSYALRIPCSFIHAQPASLRLVEGVTYLRLLWKLRNPIGFSDPEIIAQRHPDVGYPRLARLARNNGLGSRSSLYRISDALRGGWRVWMPAFIASINRLCVRLIQLSHTPALRAKRLGFKQYSFSHAISWSCIPTC